MAATRSSQDSSPVAPKGTKRAAESPAMMPVAKRGRGRPKKQQKTLEETGGIESTANNKEIEDDAEIAKQINYDNASSQPAKRGRGRPKKVRDTAIDTNSSSRSKADNMDIDMKDNEAIAKQIENTSEANGETNAFHEVKADTNDIKKVAEEGKKAKSKEIQDNAEIAKQINYGNASSQPAKRGRGRPKKVQNTAKDTNGSFRSKVDNMDIEDDEAIAKQIENTSEANGDKNAFDEVKADTDDVKKKVAEEKIEAKSKETEDNAEIAKQTNQDNAESQLRPEKVQDAAQHTNGMTNIDIEDDEAIANEIENGEANGEKNAIDDVKADSDDVENSGEANGENNGEKNASDEVKAEVKSDTDEVEKAAEEEQEVKSKEIEENNNSVVQDDKREAAIPSSILEKGIIYFFFRGRVGVEDPQGIEDVARSYIVLRPLPLGAKLGDGPLEDFGNARLLFLPKKMLPKSLQDRFLVFVEKPSATIKDLRDQFSSNEYATKTSGTSHTPSATPFAEGIYAITSTGRESHLAYQVTVPSSIGEVQKELGLNEKGSFVVSAKNPNAPGPANATLNNPASYPEEIQKKFGDLRWMPLEPELLNYQNTQFLIIGEGMSEMTKAVEEMSKDAKDDEKEKPVEELEKLEEEDHDRVEHLKGDDPVFADLDLSSQEYSKLQTTW